MGSGPSEKVGVAIDLKGVAISSGNPCFTPVCHSGLSRTPLYPPLARGESKGGKDSRHASLAGMTSGQLKKLLELLIGDPGIFDDRFEGIGVQSLMPRNRYSMCAIGHADMLAACDYYEADLTECPYRPLGRDIGEKHLRREPLPDIPWNPLFPLLSYGGMC